VHLPGEPEQRMPIPAADVSERFAPTPQRDKMPTARIPDPKETYDGFGEGFEDSDYSPINLINHPSYQELGDNKRRTRTRRSRISVNGANGKDEVRLANSLGFNNDSDLDLDSDNEIESSSENSGFFSDFPDRDTTRTPNINKSGWTEKPERNKIKLEPVKSVVEPPQIVSVEMTPEEQDMFALMGISPAVKLEQEVKNPKSVIFNVVQPGETPTTTSESSSAETSVPSTESEVSPVEMPILKNDVEEPTSSNSSTESTEENSGNISLEAETNEEETSQTSAPKRRRRRRSSASEPDES
jgi:ribonuclease E